MIPPALVEGISASAVEQSTRSATKIIRQQFLRWHRGRPAHRLCSKLSRPWTAPKAECFHRWFEAATTEEESAGKAALRFADAVVAIIGVNRVLNAAQRESIIKICNTVRAKRPLPSLHWANFVEAQLANPRFVALVLAGCVDTTAVLEPKVAAVVRRHPEVFSQRADTPVMIFGYSATLVAAIRGIPPSIARRLDVVTPLQSLQNRAVPDGEFLRDKIAGLVRDVKVVENDEAHRRLRAGQVGMLLMGCKIIGRRRRGNLEIVNSTDARRFAMAAARSDIPVAVVTGAYKLWPTSVYETNRKAIVEDKANSIVDGHYVRWIVTEDRFADRDALMNYEDYFTVDGIPVASVREGLSISRLPDHEFSATVHEMSKLARIIGALGALNLDPVTPASVARAVGLPPADVRSLLHKYIGDFIDQTYEALIELAGWPASEETEAAYQAEFRRLRRLQRIEASLIGEATRAKLEPVKAGLRILREYRGVPTER